jgi:hypothetical protein
LLPSTFNTGRVEANSLEEEEDGPREGNDHRDAGQRVVIHGIHPRGAILRLAIQCRDGKKGEWQVEDVHELYRPKQSMSKGSLPTTMH